VIQTTKLPFEIEPSGRSEAEEDVDTPPPPDRPRAIVHLDLDAFYAAVEVLENPELAGKPILIGGDPEGRGVVATASYAARDYGVHSAMPMYKAVRLCPDAIVLPTRHDLYRSYSRRVMALLYDVTPVVEKMSIDEAYLDLTERVGEWEEAVMLARRLQERVQDEVGLSASLGVATNKLVAKVASDHDKPGGLTVVQPGDEASFLAPLSVRVIWGIGPVTAEKLAAMGIETAGDLAQVSEQALVERFGGEHGVAMARRARGLDRRPVVTEHERKSVSRETTFGRDLRNINDLKRHLWRLSQSVAQRMERAEVEAGTVTVKLRYGDFETLTRQMSLGIPTSDAVRIYGAAFVLMERVWDKGRPVRLLGVGGDHLVPPTGQLPLF
jgi:DNA polymerase-4